MLLADFFIKEDSWSNQGGAGNAWHNGADDWSDGTDQWHGSDSGSVGSSEVAEDFAVTNMVTAEDDEHIDIGHILTARGLIGRAMQDPLKHKHEYFEFLKNLRAKHGSDYSTTVQQKAAKLSK